MRHFLPTLLLLSANALQAQSRDLWLIAGASILLNKDLGSPAPDGAPDDARFGTGGYRFGFRLGFGASGHIGHEIQYAYSRTGFNDRTGAILGDPGSAGMGIHQGGYNLLYYFKDAGEDSKVRPFVTGGVHISDFPLPGSAAVQRSSVKFGFNYGAGVKVRVSTLFSVRFDLREYETGKPGWNGLMFNQSGLLHQTEASAGFGIFF